MGEFWSYWNFPDEELSIILILLGWEMAEQACRRANALLESFPRLSPTARCQKTKTKTESKWLQGANVIVVWFFSGFPASKPAGQIFSFYFQPCHRFVVSLGLFVSKVTAIELIWAFHICCGCKLRDNNLSECQVTLTTGRINLPTQGKAKAQDTRCFYF